MDSTWLEDKIREQLLKFDKGQLEKLWKLRELTSLDEDQVQELRRLHDDHQLRGIIEIAKKAPSNINLLISDKLEKAPVTDYVTEFEIRRHIFERIKNIAIESPSGKINTALFAVFMVAPVHILESRLAELEDSHRRKNQTEIDEKLARWQSTILNGIQAFANRGGPQKRSVSASVTSSAVSSVANSGRGSPSLLVAPSPTKRQHGASATGSNNNSGSSSMNPSPSKRSRGHGRSASDSASSRDTPFIQPLTSHQQILTLQPAPTAQSPTLAHIPVNTAPSSRSSTYTRNPEAVKLCKLRDNNTCCFTGMPDPHAAHIFPFGVSKNATISRITDMLEMFWDADTAIELPPLIRDRHITESPQNLISMNRQLHTWFDDCKMALKPLGKTEEGVTVQFHWLNESKYKPDSIAATTDSLEKLMMQTGIRTDQSWGYIHAHRESGLQLQTGQIFTLKSDKPAHMPSFQLLKLSWDLLRIAAMCGASGEFTELSDDEDDDYYSDVEVRSTILDENDHFYVYQWRGEVENGVEIETDVEMETDKDEQPGDNAEGPF